MNAQDYLSSGLLEAYVLGGLSLTESEQVAGAMCRFPEVAAEVARLEADILSAAEQDAVAPPPDLEDKIWAAIQASGPVQKTVDISTQAPTPLPLEKPVGKVIPFEGSQARKAAPAWTRAAVLALLAGSVLMNFIILNRSEKKQDELAVERDSYKRLYEDANNSPKVAELTALVDRYRHEADMMAQPGIMPVPMLSTQPGHPMAATIYWDKAKSEAYVSVQKLPPPPTGMQYQLWAIADGKPVDIGMLDNEVAMNGGMQKVPKAVAAGQAFAVSLEKVGGNPAPTADKIFLMGKMPS